MHVWTALDLHGRDRLPPETCRNWRGGESNITAATLTIPLQPSTPLFLTLSIPSPLHPSIPPSLHLSTPPSLTPPPLHPSPLTPPSPHPSPLTPHPSPSELLGRYPVQCCHLYSEVLFLCPHVHPLSVWPDAPGGTVARLEAGAVERDQLTHCRPQHVQSRHNVLRRRRESSSMR